MHYLRFLVLILPLATLALADEKPTKAKLLFEDDFSDGAGRWQPSDAGAWKVIDTGKGKTYSQFRQSDYKPPHRSPLNFALVKDLVVGDFVLEARVRSTARDYDHRDMCLFFGYQDASHFYYVHFGKKTDDHANQIFLVNGAPRRKISTKTSDGTPWDDAWHSVKVVRRINDGSIEVYFDDMTAPVMTARDKTLLRGQVGVGSFDDTGDWAKIKVYGTVAATRAGAADAGPAQDAAKKVDTKGETPTPKPEKLGVSIHDLRAFPGYNLINPGRKQTYLFDNEGRVVHSWTSEHSSGAAAYLLDNGHLFRPSEVVKRKPGFQGPAVSGRFQEFDWDGNLVWEFEYHSAKRLPHHDAIKLPNGNVLAICWERVEEKEAIAAGRRPESVKGSHLQPDCLVEIKPTGKKTGEIVWEWRSWDHLIQDLDKTKPNYGKISEHPERFDLNYMGREEDPAPKTAAAKGQSKDAPKKVQSPVVRKNPDWMHVNAVAYNAELDQIVLSSPQFCEIWIIDHGTTTEEAKGHTGGRWGKGGDILYRWGNPRAYRSGTKLDQRLFGQHNIQWIAKGLRGEGHLLVFNNGGGRKPEEHSSVDEFVPPTDKDGNYIRPINAAFGPDKPMWSYSAPNKQDFFSWFISGAQRLPNGNTLINAGAVGVVFEVTPEQETVWKFANPFKPVRSAPPATTRIADAKKNPNAKTTDRGSPRRQGNTLFRATRYALDHPAFAGRTLKPGKTLVEIEEEFEKQKSKASAGDKATTATGSK